MLANHDHVLDYVDDYLHQLLSANDTTYVERHCEGCRLCKVALEEARKRYAALETVSPSEASGQLIEATLARIDQYELKRRRLRKVFGLAIPLALAASVAVLLCFQVYYTTLKASTFDLQLYGQNQLLAGTTGSLRIRLVNHVDGTPAGTPVEGVPVDIELLDKSTQASVHLASFTTDAQGTGQPRFQLPDGADQDYELHIIAHPNGKTETLAEPVRLKRSWKLMLTSDKPVYQPGQTIHLRSLALRQLDLKPVARQQTTFAIADPKGNLIFKQRGSTSEYGIASADCPLASEILEGAYAITCKVGDTESKVTVDVKKYVLPKFKIDVELDQPYYQPGQKVRGKVQADYFFGKPVAEGTVDIEVRTTDVGPQVLYKNNVHANAAGRAEFDFRLPEKLIGLPQQGGDASFTVLATVSDSAGQKQSRAVTRTVTASPLRIEVIPEAGTLVNRLPNRVYFYVSSADGMPVRARLTVEYRSVAAGPAGPLQVKKELTTNKLGVAAFEVAPLANQIGLKIEATTEKGLSCRKEISLNVGALEGNFLIRTDKSVYNGGDSVHLVALASGVQPVFVDFLKDDQTVLTELVEIKDGTGVAQIDLPPDLFGTVKLCAYRFDDKGFVVRKTRALFIRPAAQLVIQAALDRAEYRPGAHAKIEVRLTDDRGQPTPGALSLTAVDEAVFSVLDQAPGMERTFYLLEQQVLKPVYAIYPWSPDLTTSEESQERDGFEQVLFARTAQSTEPIETPWPPRGRWGSAGSSPMPQNVAVKGGSPFTLTSTSLPSKIEQTEADRQAGLAMTKQGWIILGVLTLLAGYTAVWVFCRPIWLVLVLHGLLIVPALLFVSLDWYERRNWASSPEADRMIAKGDAVPAMDEAWRGRQAARDKGMRAAPPPPAPANRHAATGVAPLMADGMKHVQVPEAPVESAAPVRVREWFPETLLWRPQVITDNQGQASVDVDLADSITTWRLTASAVSADGRLGALQKPLRVFQPFFVDLNLPVALTRGDEVAIPVVVYNYLSKPQTVSLQLDNSTWFERLDDSARRLDLAAGEVRSTSYRIRVIKVGTYQLQVTARGSGVADALKKDIEVVPDGQRLEQVHNGSLQQPVDLTLSVPADAIDGSAHAILKLYPTTFSQLVEGLDAIFQMPYGCFEQTSSTTYPNVLALDYLRRTGKSVPEVEAKARQYIHLGYQRLLSFEVSGGGFDWFGRPPANRTLTAYGLMEFQDMARVHDVDPRLIERTRQWLLRQRDADGSWSPAGHMLHEDPTRGGPLARVSTTAYIAWAVFSDSAAGNDAQPTAKFLLEHSPSSLTDAHVLALVSNALLAIDPDGRSARSYLARLEGLRHTSADGKLVWWEQPAQAHTTFYGAGRSGSVETTALAILAILRANENLRTVPGALSWLVQQKDARGTWQSTQATVLALKALLAGTGAALGGERDRQIEIAWGPDSKRVIHIPADQADVMQQIDLSGHLTPGQHRLVLTDTSGLATGYQVAFRYHVAGAKPPEQAEPLAIELAYDRTELAVGDTVRATATITNRMTQTAPMVLLDLPIPAGFALAAEDLADLVGSGSIAKYQINPRSAIVYLRGLEVGKPLTLRYRLHATMPVKVAVAPARVYEYYDKDKHGSSTAARLVVTPGR
jgi:hypothetical protein